MTATTSDQSVLRRIEELVEDEHVLLARGALDESDKKRLETVQVELDRSWDLLRQRRALREFGADPDLAEVRPAEVVEEYEQ